MKKQSKAPNVQEVAVSLHGAIMSSFEVTQFRF